MTMWMFVQCCFPLSILVEIHYNTSWIFSSIHLNNFTRNYFYIDLLRCFQTLSVVSVEKLWYRTLLISSPFSKVLELPSDKLWLNEWMQQLFKTSNLILLVFQLVLVIFFKLKVNPWKAEYKRKTLHPKTPRSSV